MTNPELWADRGLNSQGKIITALLRREFPEALLMVRQWSSADLRSLEEAGTRLARMAGRELRSRERGFVNDQA